MEFMKIVMAYNEIQYGKETLDNVLEMIKQMPDKKASFDNGRTLLHLASQMLHPSAVKYLLAEGCDPNSKNTSGDTPLILVARQKQLLYIRPENSAYEVTCALIDGGANAALKDNRGEMIYIIAAKNGNGEMIKALHDKGVRITRADDSGNNGIHYLIESLYNPLNDFRLAEKRYNDEAPGGVLPAGREFVKKNMEDSKRSMEFYLNEAFVGAKAFLDSGVDPEDKNNMGETAHVLAERRGTKKIGALLKGELGDAGANSELAAKAGGLTIVKAALKGDREAILALIELGSDVNAVEDIYGYGEGTPLAGACRNCDAETVKLLLGLGADPNLKTGDGRTAITWLKGGEMHSVSQNFEKKNPTRIIDAMVASGMDINAFVNDRSDTLLMWALRDSNGDMEMFVTRETLRWYVVNSAISHGADVNRSNIDGQTPLMLSCIGDPNYSMRMADEIQMLLLQKGANIAARDKNGNTPLIYVANNSNAKAAKEMAENLFDFGDPQAGAVNNAGKSALDIATEKNNEMLVKLLLKNM